MKSFRAVYNLEMKASRERFCIHVIGHRMVFDHIVNVPHGLDCVFMHIFHDPVLVQTSDGLKQAPANSLFIINAHTPIYLEGSGPWSHSWIRVSGTALDGMVSASRIPYNTIIPFDDEAMNMNFLLSIHREMHHPKGMISANVEELFKIWLRNIGRELIVEEKYEIPASFLKARHYVETNYLQQLTLEEITSVCYLSRATLCRGFQQYYGISPIEYAIQLRLQHARELFPDINLNLSAIALQSGFKDVYYFSRMFKKHYGMSPKKYRFEYNK